MLRSFCSLGISFTSQEELFISQHLSKIKTIQRTYLWLRSRKSKLTCICRKTHLLGWPVLPRSLNVYPSIKGKEPSRKCHFYREAGSSGQKILCYPLSCSRFGLSLGQPGELGSWLSRLFVSQLSCQENDFCNCVSLMCQEIDKSSQPS